MGRAGGVLLTFVFAFLLVGALVPVAGEHEPSHRYFVAGTVTSEAGGNLCGVTVRAADITKPNFEANRTATTDLGGRYSIQIHMHSSVAQPGQDDEGNSIRVSVEGTTQSRIVTAIPNGDNPQGWGQQTADFVVAPDVPRAQCITDYALWIGLVVAILVIGFIALRFVRRPRGGKAATRSLTRVPGVGRTRARDLQGAGIRTAEDLAGADPDDVAEKTKMTRKQARLLVKRAQEYVGDGKG